MTHNRSARKYDYMPGEEKVWAAFVAIVKFIKKNGYPPSIREVRDLAQLSSTSVTSDCLRELENRRWIKRPGVTGTSREIVITNFGSMVYDAENRRSEQPAIAD